MKRYLLVEDCDQFGEVIKPVGDHRGSVESKCPESTLVGIYPYAGHCLSSILNLKTYYFLSLNLSRIFADTFDVTPLDAVTCVPPDLSRYPICIHYNLGGS